MNPLKAFKDSVPALKQVMESIHAHLERILEENEKQTAILKDINENSRNVCSIEEQDKDTS